MPQSPFQIRPATADDLDTVAELFDGYRQFYEQAPDLSGSRAFVGERLRVGDSHIILATDGEGTGAGFVQLYPIFSSVRMCRVWILNDLFVAPAARGRGVAVDLMRAAADTARAAGVKALQLETAADNVPAKALYERLGWSLESGFDHYSIIL